MTDRQVEHLAMRAAAGENVCARVTRRLNGELVTLGPESTRTGRIAQGAVFAGAFAVGVPVAAQSIAHGSRGQDNAEVILKEVAPEPQPIPGMAVVVGRLLHPDGRRVDTGLVYVQSPEGYGPLYVVDESGWFEIHTPPGVYDFVVQTGKDQAERMPGVVLHEGVQQFADIRTRSGQEAISIGTETTMGTTVSVVTTRWGWHAFRHPVLYVRYLMRKT